MGSTGSSWWHPGCRSTRSSSGTQACSGAENGQEGPTAADAGAADDLGAAAAAQLRPDPLGLRGASGVVAARGDGPRPAGRGGHYIPVLGGVPAAPQRVDRSGEDRCHAQPLPRGCGYRERVVLPHRDPCHGAAELVPGSVRAMIWTLAHGNETHLSEAFWGWWTWDPFILLFLAVSGWLYIRGLRRLWARAGVGQGIRKWEAGAFAAGWISVVIALISPLDPLSDILFSAHMAQHEVLMLVSAPLLVLGRTLLAFLWAFGAERRERIGRWTQSPRTLSVWHGITGPLVVWVLHAVALWVWHIPDLYEAALRDEAVHVVQHLSFFVTACLFWWALVYGRFGRIGYGMAVFYVFTTAVYSSILGALITIARR